jgi:predicted RNA-binding protein with PUA-like domain
VPKWLVKTEPSTYAWQQLAHEKRTRWDGVRNAQARNNLAAMKAGDEVLVYHSGDERAVIGIAKVAKAAYADPTSDDERWVCVDLVPVRALAAPVELTAIKKTPSLANFALVRQSRLSVMPVSADEFQEIVALSKKR